MPNATQSPTSAPAVRHTPLEDIDPDAASAARAMRRVTDVPDRRANRLVTFNSAA
ncbi:FxSxx-COOH cyclophane-containing RiPP peptide [Streptomyces sp. NPDC047061]|uniref:FxSxx-COOH cyclophane-containing RiPP peptide n=1 Tax=unclassified Streptomyces TaxID=2593676 RepID=UPI0033FC7351